MPHIPACIAGAASAAAQCPKHGVMGPAGLGSSELAPLAATEELQRALETSCFASTLQAEGKS